MKIQKILSSAITAFLVLTLGLPTTAMANPPTRIQAVNAVQFPADVEAQPSAGILTRQHQLLVADMALSGLDQMAAYTVWWIIWNDPSLCATTPCSGADLGIKGNVVTHAAGFVTGDDGVANVTARLAAGKLPVGKDSPIPTKLWKGRGMKAEVHMLVQSHGSIWPGKVHMQISIDGAACNPTCAGQQAMIFVP